MMSVFCHLWRGNSEQRVEIVMIEFSEVVKRNVSGGGIQEIDGETL